MICELEAIGEQRIGIEEFFGNPRAHSWVHHIIVIIVAITYESFSVSLISPHILVTMVLIIAKYSFAVCPRLHIAVVLAPNQMHCEKGY